MTLADITPPLNMQAPEGVYQAFYALFIAQLALVLAVIIVRSLRRRTWLPLASLAGAGAMGVFFAPVYDRLGLCWFPTNIPGTAIEAFGMRDPAFDPIGYALFFGFGGWCVYEQIKARRGARVIWGIAAGFAVADLLYELPFLGLGLYRYYGDQPLTVGGYPLHWAFVNASAPLITGICLYLVLERGSGGQAAKASRAFAVPWVAGTLLLLPLLPVVSMLNGRVSSAARVAAALLAMAISVAVIAASARFADTIREAHSPPETPSERPAELVYDDV